MRPCMAFFTQGAQVLVPMVAAFSKRQNMVDFLGFPVDSFRKTFLAKRVGVNVTVADAFPSSAVASLGGRVAVVFFVSFILLFLVLRAESSLGEVRASGVGARPFRFPWHIVAPNEKPPQELLPRRLYFAIFYAITISGITGKSVRDITHAFPKSRTERCATARFFLL